MLIDKEMLDALSEEARKSPRVRMGKDMRTSVADQSQRMLNAMEPGTEVAIHRHTKTTETVAVIRGKVRQKYYNEKGQLVREDVIGSGGACPFNIVPKISLHTTECLEPGTIIFDCKDGVYEPLAPEDIMQNE